MQSGKQSGKRTAPAAYQGLGPLSALRRWWPGTDRLTGLTGPHRFRDASVRALLRGARTQRYSAVLMIGVHEPAGAEPADRVLAEFAKVLRGCVPATGLPARLGGDEFAVVLPGLVHPEQAYEVAGRLAATLAPVVIDGRLVTLAAGIGVAVSGPGQLTHDELVHRAARAMNQAKRLGPHTRWAAWQESYGPEPGLSTAA